MEKFLRCFVSFLSDLIIDASSVLEVTQKGTETDKGREGKYQLSHIIKQLDYVLQLSRGSIHHQHGEFLASEESTSVSPTSCVQATNSPVEFSSRDKNVEPKEIPEDEKNPMKSSSLEHEEKADLIHPSQDHLPQTVKLHYVQEKTPYRLQSGKKRSHQTHGGKVSSPGDVSTADASLTSSEN